ncbi:putative late blight resistance protein -like protein R1B-14-like [Capsicum annuum]|nr:putative late blight resistance protein -like protein R1B-14-like [Capsicum annuum]
MTKMGVRPSRIVDLRKKKVLLDKRLESLYKKAKHLEILCDIEIGMFFFTPGDQNIFAWPSLTQATDRVKNYLAFFDKKCPIKMVKHEDLLQSVLNAKEGKINQLEKTVEKKEMEYNFNQLVEAGKRFDELEVSEIRALINLFTVKRAQLDERAKQLNENVETEIDSNDYNDGEKNDGHL